MKRALTFVIVAGMFAFIACGPSAEEKAAMDKARQDSIATVEKARQDSIDAAEKAHEEMEKARQDSIAAVEKAKQDSIEAAAEKSKKGAKSNTAPKKDPSKVKAGEGKG